MNLSGPEFIRYAPAVRPAMRGLPLASRTSASPVYLPGLIVGNAPPLLVLLLGRADGLLFIVG